MLTGTTTTETYECGAGCGQTFADLADVFSHPCDSTPEWMAARGLRPQRPVERHDTTRGDSIDAPERGVATGRRAEARPPMTNRYPGNCQRCGRRVEAGEGHAVKNHAGGRGVSWAVEHKVSECPAIGARRAVPAARPVEDAPDVTATPDTPPAGPPMSERQESFLRSLIAERETHKPMNADEVVAILNGLPNPRQAASALIDNLTKLPRKAAPAPAAADGYEPEKGDVHVVDGEFYRVHKAQGSGRFYAVRWVPSLENFSAQHGFSGGGGDWEFARGAMRLLSADTLATAEDAARFGELFHCCVFCTRPLDTPESTAVGYGPTCAAKRGLPWG